MEKNVNHKKGIDGRSGIVVDSGVNERKGEDRKEYSRAPGSFG